MTSYDTIESLESISEKAVQTIGANSYIVNFDLKVSFDISLIESSKLTSFSELALDFQNPECPESLHINHGKYIHKKNDGIQNVIDELKKKKTSNRAIISLINQEDIVDSEDNPIPSFMVLQFSLENNNELFITTYFRALEVSYFLNINVEEIRFIIEKIKAEIIDITKVNLNIISFRAYCDSDINPLLKPKIELLNSKEILNYLLSKKDIKDLLDLLREKNKSSTVIEYDSFSHIIDWLKNDCMLEYIHDKLKKPLVLELLFEIVNILKELKEFRKKSSHNVTIESLQSTYNTKIESLIRTIEDDS